MECTGWTVLQGFGLWGGIFLALSRLVEWMGDNLELVGEIFGLFLVLPLFYSSISHIHA